MLASLTQVSRSCHSVWPLHPRPFLLLAGLATACGPVPQSPDEQPGQPQPELSASFRAQAGMQAAPSAQTLSVGFSSVDLTWRAGAKPGQVGTAASTLQISLLWKDLIGLILPVYRLQMQNKPLEGLQVATDWTVDYLNGKINEMPYDDYVGAFEPGRGLHTRSSVKAFVAESNGQKVAVVRADLYLMQKLLWRRVAELVAAETGLKPENILIAATHNHSAADATFTAAGISTFADTFDSRHYVFVTQQISEAIRQADANRRPARMKALQTTLRATQRNIIGPATAEVVPPGGTTPVTVSAGYPKDFFDDALSIVTFEDASSSAPLFSYLVFATHPESLKDGHGLLSSDFVGLMEDRLETRWGYPVMWSTGALGDVEQDDGTNFGTDFWREDFSRLELQAQTLENAIGPKLEQAPAAGDVVVPARGDIVVASRLKVFPGAENLSYPGPTPWQLPVTEYLSPEFPVTCVRALTETANMMLQTIQLGDVVLLGAPSEVTSDLAKHIRSRVDNQTGNLYQGYVWPDAEPWVEAEIQQNFDQQELDASTGFVLPILLGQSNDYMGYMVTRWEFNNRHHYRQEMTLYGEETANYVAAGFEELVRELRGATPASHSFDEPSTLDMELEEDVYAVIRNLEPTVAAWAKMIPAQDKSRIGKIVKNPELVATDEMGVPSVHFAWKGGTSDLPIPTVIVERSLGNGVWTQVLDERHSQLWLLYSSGGTWEAVWHLKNYPGAGTYRFIVRGVYRSTVAGSMAPDSIWDPDGKNAPYQLASISLDVP